MTACMRLQGRTALVAGAGRNIGKAIALTFAREGADLILVAREPGHEVTQVAKACEELGARAVAIPADVGKHEEVNRVVSLGLERFGKVDVLVCGTALRPHKPFWEYSYEEWHDIFAVNLHSTFYFAKAIAPGMMRQRSGTIIGLGSWSGMTAVPNAAVEVAAKHGLHGLIKSLALELAPFGVRANVLALGPIATERRNPEWYATKSGTPAFEQFPIPLGRKGTVQEAANVALFLASDESSYVTGDQVLCAGGSYM